MDAPTGHCDLCDLPLAYCEHGRPAPQPAPTTRPSKPAARRTTPTKPQPAPRGSASGASRGGVTSRSVGRRRTPPEEFRPLILEVLQQADHELEADEVFAALEARVGEEMRTGDRETTPEGELRWQYAARRARQGLIADGLMAKGRPGVWVLTDAGRREEPASP